MEKRRRKRIPIKPKHMPTQKVTGIVKSVSVKAGQPGKKEATITLEVDEHYDIEGEVNTDQELDIELPSRPQP